MTRPIYIFILKDVFCFFKYDTSRTFKHVDTVTKLYTRRNVTGEQKCDFTANDYQMCLKHMCFLSVYFKMSTSFWSISLSSSVMHEFKASVGLLLSSLALALIIIGTPSDGICWLHQPSGLVVISLPCCLGPNHHA